MGGTWVSWGQPHVWREISRYGMQSNLEISQEYSHGMNKFSLAGKSGRREMEHSEEVSLSVRATWSIKLTCLQGYHRRIRTEEICQHRWRIWQESHAVPT